MQYYCLPPRRAVGTLADNAILTDGFSAELDLDSSSADIAVLSQLDADELCDYVPMEAVARPADGELPRPDNGAPRPDNELDDGATVVSGRSKVSTKKKKAALTDRDAIETADAAEGTEALQLRKTQRLGRKKADKEQRRGVSVPYDFETDFSMQ